MGGPSELGELQPLAIGQELLDRRLVVRGVLGRGSMGVVYRADDRLLSRQVALKTLASFDADQIYSLKRGFRTLAGLSHRNLVQLYELCAADQLWFLIMELIEGQELASWLRHHPTRQRLLHVFGEVAEGIRVLHAAGLRHRDVKPANVMVKAADEAVLLDFGLAAPIRTGDITLTAGTLDYMAPEQFWNESPAEPADWYSFGAMLFEALTGSPPFTGADRLKAMRRGPVIGPSALAADVPPAIDDLVTRLLAPDPAARPGPAEIARVLDVAPAPRAVTRTHENRPFVGRTTALERMHRCMHDVRSGQTRLLHLHGPSGIGKTALATHFLAQLRAAGDVLILEGGCHPQESVPYNALDGLVDSLGRHLLSLDHRAVLALAPRHAAALLHLFPVLGRVPAVREWPVAPLDASPAEVRRRGGEALRDVLGRLADRNPAVLWIDDVQWSDRDSGVLLQGIVAPPDAPRLLVLLTSRDEHGAEPLVSAVSESLQRVDVRLESLSRFESHALALALADDAELGTDLESVATEAGGSPFLVGEFVRYLRTAAERGHDTVREPFTIDVALQSRFRPLAPEARRLFDLVAVAGKPLDVDLALAAAGLDPSGRLLAYALCAASLLRITIQDGRQFVEVYHDRLRQFAVGSMGETARRSGHRVLADAILASRTPDSRSVVRHLLEADAREEAAVHAGLAAQDAARDLAFDQAVEMYDVALAHGSHSRDRALRERRADMLAYAGRRAEAALAYESAAELREDDQARATLRLQAAEQFLYGGDLKRGLEVLESVLGDVGIRVPRTALGRSLRGLWYRLRFIARGPSFEPRDPASLDRATAMRLDTLWRTTRGLVMLDPALAGVLAGQHLLESLHHGDASRAIRALGLEAALEANIGGRWLRRRGYRLLEVAEHAAAEHGTAYDRAWLSQSRAVCLFFGGRWREALAQGRATEALVRATEIGASWDLAALQGFMLSALANLGDIRELTRRAHELVSDAERRQDQYALRVFRTGDAVVIWLAADRVEMALRLADETLIDYAMDQFTSQHRHHMVASVHAHLYAGEPSPAWERVQHAWPLLRRAGFLLMDCLGTQLRYLRACTALAMARGASPRARPRFLEVAQHEARRIARSELPMAAPMAHAIDAGLAGARAQREAQRRALGQAAYGFERAEMALYCAAARWHAAAAGLSAAEEGEASRAWMERQSIMRPDLMARAVVPEA